MTFQPSRFAAFSVVTCFAAACTFGLRPAAASAFDEAPATQPAQVNEGLASEFYDKLVGTWKVPANDQMPELTLVVTKTEPGVYAIAMTMVMNGQTMPLPGTVVETDGDRFTSQSFSDGQALDESSGKAVSATELIEEDDDGSRGVMKMADDNTLEMYEATTVDGEEQRTLVVSATRVE